MKIHLYKDTENEIPWVREYKKLYAAELKKLGVNVEWIETASGVDGILLLSHAAELEKHRLDQGKMRLIMQMNGTTLQRYNRHVDRKQELIDLKECWLNLTANESLTQYARKKFKIKNIFTVGFPVREPVLTKLKEKGLFVVAGKLDPSKLVTLSIKIAFDHPDFKRLIICYPKSSKHLLKYYPKAENNEKISYKECNHEELMDVLEVAEYFVVSSLDDTINITQVEAMKSGCKTIAVEHNEVLPHYTKNQENINLFCPENCAKNLIKLIQDEIQR